MKKTLYILLCSFFCFISTTSNWIAFNIPEETRHKISWYVDVTQPGYLNTFLHNISSLVQDENDPRLAELIEIIGDLREPIHEAISPWDKIQKTEYYKQVLWFEKKRSAAQFYLLALAYKWYAL